MANALTRAATALASRLGLAPTILSGAEVETRDQGITFGIGGSPSGDGWTSLMNGNLESNVQGLGTQVRRLGFEQHPIVQACVRCIADIIATVDFEVYKKDIEGQVVDLPNSPALMLLHSPRVGMNRQRLRALTAVHYLLYGNVYWVLERDTPDGLPKAIRLVHPENIYSTWLDRDTQEILVYEWHDRTGSLHKTLAPDMIHFKDLAGGDWLFGFPRAAAALIDISGDYEAGQFVRQMVINNGTPSLAVLVEGAVTRTELDAAEERWQEKMARRGKRGGVAMMSGVKQLQQFSFNMRDLEFTALRGIAREDICAVFGVDPRMIAVASARGQEGGLSGVQYREARFRLIQQTIMPIMGAIEAVLDDWFAPEYGDIYCRFDPDSLSALTENEVETSDRSVKEMQAGLITREEARMRIGMPAEMDEEDVLVGTTGRSEYLVSEQFDHATGLEVNPLAGPLDPNDPNVIAEPPTQTGEPTAAPTPDSSTSEAPPKKPTDIPAKPPSSLEKAARAPRIDSKSRSDAEPSLGMAKVFERGAALSPAQRGAIWQQFDQRATKAEAPFKRAAVILFHAEKVDVRRKLEAAARSGDGRSSTAPLARVRRDSDASDPHVAAALRNIAADYAPGGDYHQAWLDRYEKLIGQTFKVAGEDVAASAGFDFDLANPKVQAAIVDRATTLATYVGQASSDQISAAVSAGRAAGMGISDIADMIDESVFGSMAESRAETIARTETIGSMNQGEFTAAQESGVIQSCEWLTDGDDLVRESHAEQDGEIVDLGDTFANGLQFPGDQDGEASEVINCRCTLLYHDQSADDQ